MSEKLSAVWEILRLSVRIIHLRIKIRRLDNSNRKLRARLEQLDRQISGARPSVYPTQRAIPLVKIGPGGDYVQEFYAGSMN